MDTSRFDRLTRSFCRTRNRPFDRRTGLRALLAGTLVGLFTVLGGDGDATAQRKRTQNRRQPRDKGSRFSAQGPCGNGRIKANTCRRHRQCCTGYCHRRSNRCRCRQRSQTCTEDRNCCQPGGQDVGCFRRRCRPRGRCGTGGPCQVFVTSSEHTGALGGVSGADAICQDLADATGLPGTYLAWLSDATTSPASRFVHNRDPYILVDGTVIAADWQELTSGTLRAPIDLTEQEDRVAWSVWTYTRTDGSAGNVFEENAHCDTWSSDTPEIHGGVGQTNRTDELWTNAGWTICTTLQRLYCFQQG